MLYLTYLYCFCLRWLRFSDKDDVAFFQSNWGLLLRAIPNAQALIIWTKNPCTFRRGLPCGSHAKNFLIKIIRCEVNLCPSWCLKSILITNANDGIRCRFEAAIIIDMIWQYLIGFKYFRNVTAILKASIIWTWSTPDNSEKEKKFCDYFIKIKWYFKHFFLLSIWNISGYFSFQIVHNEGD